METLIVVVGVVAFASCTPNPDGDDREGSDSVRATPADPAPAAGAALRVEPNRCSGGFPPDSGPEQPETRVTLPTGRELLLRECLREGESYLRLAYRASILDGQYHLVESAYYEGGGWILVSDRSGRLHAVSGRPEPSPDGRFLASWSSDLEAGYAPNEVEILRVGPDSLESVYRADGGFDWGVSSARWESPERLVYWRVRSTGWVDGRPTHDSSRVTLFLDGASWVEAQEPNR